MLSDSQAVYTQCYTVKSTPATASVQIHPYRPFKAMRLLVKTNNVGQRMRVMFGNMLAFAAPMPVTMFLAEHYNLLIRHAFEHEWEEDRLAHALARFDVCAPMLVPGSAITFEVDEIGDTEFTVLGKETISGMQL